MITETVVETQKGAQGSTLRKLTLLQRLDDWSWRRFWRYQYRRAHRNAFKIAEMGQDNRHAQPFLNVAKDNLYLAAREFDLMADWWTQGCLRPRPRKAPSVPGTNEKV